MTQTTRVMKKKNVSFPLFVTSLPPDSQCFFWSSFKIQKKNVVLSKGLRYITYRNETSITLET
jgi:hypothetical protein